MSTAFLRLRVPSIFLLGMIYAVSVARGHFLRTDRSNIYVIPWEPGIIPIQVKLPPPPTTPFIDGSNYQASFVAAIESWNARLGVVRMVPAIAAEGTYAFRNNVNEVVMANTVEGLAFPAGTLALTLARFRFNTTIEVDIIFNRAETWDSYRGVRRPGLRDFQRVAMHELGHLLGLDHPDEARPPQRVEAIMNSVVSDVDRLQADDITGAQLLYGARGVLPANDYFANATAVTMVTGSVSVTGSNIGSTFETGEPFHADEVGWGSSWWRWTPPISGVYTITSLGSNFDTIMGMYSGSAVNALTRIASNDDVTTGVIRTSAFTALVVEGTPYFIAVDGWAGSYGQITLNMTYGRVDTDPPSRFSNVSTNTTLSVNEQVVPGFVIEGTGNRDVLIRAIGPGLTQFGVSGVLEDPTITLNRIVDGVATVVATNDNWSASLAPTFQSAGAFPLTIGSNDAALEASLQPGSYTVTVGGKAGSSGQVIVEIYESKGGSTPDGKALPSRFLNLSTNTTLSVSEQVVPGFVIEGPRSRNVLIRAIGPGLTQFGVGAVLADPTMTLNRIAGGVASVIATNDDWAASLATTFTAAGAFPLSVGSKDAAIQVHLLPGSYTITVGGKAGNSGQVLVELYEIR